MEKKDWTKLSFAYSQTNTVLTCLYKDGKWGPIESQTAATLNLTVFSPSLHYGMSCFEGLKAFRGADDKVRIFRMDENARRMQSSAGFLGIPCPGCCSQRAIHSLLNLDLKMAFKYNALVVLILPALATLITSSLFRDRFPLFYRITHHRYVAISFLILIISWLILRIIFHWYI
jgi:branched-chain amino acid aminotransferase